MRHFFLEYPMSPESTCHRGFFECSLSITVKILLSVTSLDTVEGRLLDILRLGKDGFPILEDCKWDTFALAVGNQICHVLVRPSLQFSGTKYGP